MTRIVSLVLAYLLVAPLVAAEVPPNTWQRIADCPGDADGREVPPGRGATWVYEPNLKVFLRYGGYTPRFSNALDAFDPATGKWTRLVAEDENYPADRPGGGCRWSMQYDAKRKVVYIAAGLANGATGANGIWSYDAAQKKFAPLTTELPPHTSRIAFDPVHDVFVASPGPGSEARGYTMVFPLKTRKWERRTTTPLPQGQWAGGYPSVFHAGINRVVVIGNETVEAKGGLSVWTYDVPGNKWIKVETNAGPANRGVTSIAYDPDNKVILLHGVGKDGRDAGDNVLNDTWVLDVEKKEWKEIKTPGLPILKGIRDRAELLYRQALAYDAASKHFLLSDPDLGVWAFRYDPKAPPGSQAVAGGFVPEVGKAAANPPADGPKEVRLSLPSSLNKRILDLADNTVIPLGGGRLPGDEVAWTYDSDAGVFLKTGGCGNWSSPFWTGYGNNLLFYDPGTEKWHTRRVGDVSGALRPGTGCTRSVVYDPARKVTWLFGGTASGPYCPAPASGPGEFYYDLKTDRFVKAPRGGVPSEELAQIGCLLTLDPERHLVVLPHKDRTWVFDTQKAAWSIRQSPDSPGKSYEYTRQVYAKSKKVFLALARVEKEKGKPENRTMSYDPAANQWNDLDAKNQPPFRGSKYGLVYDSKNDVVLLLGGGENWNQGWRNDLWVYLVQENRWEKLTPRVVDAKEGPKFLDNMPSAYDERHNAIIFTDGNAPWAYRYKK